MATNALIYSQYHASCTGGSAGETVAMAAGETQLRWCAALIGLTDCSQLLLKTGGIVLWVMFHGLSACQF